MGKIFNMIISNDLLFYGIIVFLIMGIIILFIYLHHKKVISILENEIEFTKVEDEQINESLKNLAEVSNIESSNKEIDEKISKLDGKLAIEKIMNETSNEDVKEEKIIQSKSEINVKNIEESNVDVKKETVVETTLKTEVEEKISEQPKSELEIMLEKMQKDLEEQKEKDAVAIFEQEQEEKSIISYKELLEKKKELESMTELFTDERFENEATVIEDDETLSDSYFELVDNINDTISIEQTKEEDNLKNKKFVTTDFISPVFGRRKAEFDYPKVPNFKDMMIKKEKTNEYDLEATLNLEPLTDQIKRDDAFLSALKEFRKNLE